MASVLIEYIERSALTPWEWGKMDCVMFAAGWVLGVTGIDIAAPIRGKYATTSQARRLIKRNGGFLSGIGAHIDDCGFVRTRDPRDGDFGIVDAPIAMRDRMPVVGAVMAIRSGGLWVCKSERGMVAADMPFAAAWKI